ncbi:tyrosine-type recombinase/integrase [Sinorhizobium psoraleae]|uniref:Tyrosine-type recombinase/integrase n=1 Tax=Sinorhizobium psoraleae TaxID=520838 RepID=A0ABT4KFN5_9HYPH|nr:tyrosine-type recombinase/integrase [Sinorhizobium psoraleae]MCZ4090788.1 tyrosine-type recombinase/integrase [Sinorhizobium psoraleae]
MHPSLIEALQAAPEGKATFLLTSFGKPFTPAGFGNWFRERCDEAGLPHCSSHGLRKAAARRLAEAGNSANHIAAVTGHLSLKEVERYTRAADQEKDGRCGCRYHAGTLGQTNSNCPTSRRSWTNYRIRF